MPGTVIRKPTSIRARFACMYIIWLLMEASRGIRVIGFTSIYVNLRQLTSIYVIGFTSIYVNLRRITSDYVRLHQITSDYVGLPRIYVGFTSDLPQIRSDSIPRVYISQLISQGLCSEKIRRYEHSLIHHVKRNQSIIKRTWKSGVVSKTQIWLVNTMANSFFTKTMKWSHGHYGHFACSTLFQT